MALPWPGTFAGPCGAAVAAAPAPPVPAVAAICPPRLAAAAAVCRPALVVRCRSAALPSDAQWMNLYVIIGQSRTRTITTMPARMSDRAASPSLLSELPMALTPMRKTTVMINFETIRAEVASIQARRQRAAGSQPPPAPAKTARVTRTRMATLRSTIVPQYMTAPTTQPRATRAGTAQPSWEVLAIKPTLMTRETASEVEVLAILNSPFDSASTTLKAMPVPATATNENSTPEIVPVTAWDRA